MEGNGSILDNLNQRSVLRQKQLPNDSKPPWCIHNSNLDYFRVHTGCLLLCYVCGCPEAENIGWFKSKGPRVLPRAVSKLKI